MREIKFRVFDGEKMIPAINIFVNGLGFIFENKRDGFEGVDELVDTKDYIIMQFTGLLDKNGKEIYDGDILIDYDKSHSNNNIPRLVEICPLGLTLGGSGSIGSWAWKWYEVIGNIHENPDLI